MTLVIALYVPEGIVMAADSRMTLNKTEKRGENQVVQLAAVETDTTYKLFVTSGLVGIATYGDAEAGGTPIAGLIEGFIRERLADDQDYVDKVPPLLLEFFRTLTPIPTVYFLVAGYAKDDSRAVQRVWDVNVASNAANLVNPKGEPGASWGGEADVLTRLVKPVAELDSSGKPLQALPHNPIPWKYFTLQDSIDFAIHAVQATIDSMRFQPRAKTVGGPVDVLVISPTEAKWIRRKELHG